HRPRMASSTGSSDHVTRNATTGLNASGSAAFFKTVTHSTPERPRSATALPQSPPRIACVVETGNPCQEAKSTQRIAAVMIAKPKATGEDVSPLRIPVVKVFSIAVAHEAAVTAPSIVQMVPHKIAVW